MSQVLLGAAGWEGAQRVGKGAALVLAGQRGARQECGRTLLHIKSKCT